MMKEILLAMLLGTATPVDGDTLTINHTRVRLAAIDAPEMGQPAGINARNALERLLRGVTVSCTPETLDRYRRIVARCSTPAVPDIGREMVRQGWALPYLKYGGAVYQPEADAARAARAGIYATSFIDPAAWRRGQRLDSQRY